MYNENALASFCLFTYNQVNYIVDAIEGAMAQSYDHLEIIISDDASTDGTQEKILQTVKNYSGPHKIILNFNEVNLGLSSHVNKVLYEICNGEYIFLAAGDDISLPNRVKHTMDFYFENKNVIATGSNLQEINRLSSIEDSQNFKKREQAIYDLNYYLSSAYQHLYGCTRTFSNKLVKSFPPLHCSCPTEDTPLLFRAFLLNKSVAFLEETMVLYRIHENNISAPLNLAKMSINAIFAQYERDLTFAKERGYITSTDYLNLKQVLKVRKKARIGKRGFVQIAGKKLNNLIRLFGKY